MSKFWEAFKPKVLIIQDNRPDPTPHSTDHLITVLDGTGKPHSGIIPNYRDKGAFEPGTLVIINPLDWILGLLGGIHPLSKVDELRFEKTITTLHEIYYATARDTDVTKASEPQPR